MQVSYERTGGFAGMRFSTTVDSQSLEEEEETRLKEEVFGAGFFDLPEKIPTLSTAGAVDRFEYQITVEWEGQHHSVVVAEAAMPDSLRPLVDHLEQLMRTRRGT